MANARERAIQPGSVMTMHPKGPSMMKPPSATGTKQLGTKERFQYEITDTKNPETGGAGACYGRICRRLYIYTCSSTACALRRRAGVSHRISSSSWEMTSAYGGTSGAYSRGMMAGRTPNLDKLAKEGMLFTDYYAEASCTAGRANFITGELPIRTGMTTVGQAGAKIAHSGGSLHDCDPPLKALGYETGQFGEEPPW